MWSVQLLEGFTPEQRKIAGLYKFVSRDSAYQFVRNNYFTEIEREEWSSLGVGLDGSVSIEYTGENKYGKIVKAAISRKGNY